MRATEARFLDSRSLISARQPLWCRTLGELALYADVSETRPIMGAGKPLALLAYLALSPNSRAGRDHVAQLFWPGAPQSDARHDVRQILYRLRQLTDGHEVVRAIGSELRLAPDVHFDFLQGEAALAGGNVARACELLRGNFLDGFAIPESLEFERWAEAERSRFRDAWGRAALSLVEQWLGSGEAERALSLADELHAQRPFS